MYKQKITEAGYKLCTRSEFETATDRPAGLLERAQHRVGAFVVYDPHDDADGWLLIGDDAEALARETWEYRVMEPR
jgi:hypothetical protein